MNTMLNYGYQELRASYNRTMGKAMIISILLVLSMVAVYHLTLLLQKDDEIAFIRSTHVIRLDQLTLPPSMGAPQTAAVSAANVKPSYGIPVPIPDILINPEQDFATIKDLAINQPANTITDQGNQEPTDIIIPKDENDPAPETFTPMEVEPTIILKPTPAYPELATKANLEGNVIVKMLIAKDGTVKKAFVLKSTEEIFNDAALTAAKKWVFRPAMMNNKPVAVWVSIPFKFYLKK